MQLAENPRMYVTLEKNRRRMGKFHEACLVMCARPALAFVLVFQITHLAFAQDLDLRAVENGMQIYAVSTSPLDRIVLSPPTIRKSETDFAGKEPPRVEILSDQSLVARYDNGAEITMTARDNFIDCSASGLPDGTHSLNFSVVLPIRLVTGWKYAFDDKPFETFPDVEADELFKGHTSRFSLAEDEGRGFSIAVPECPQSLADSRKVNWQCYLYRFAFVLTKPPEETNFRVQVTSLTP